MASDPMLAVSKLCAAHGVVEAVRDVDVQVPQGALVALVGANGAGKTTTLNSIAGLHKPSSGRVLVGGRDVTGWPCHRLVRAGVALVAEGRRVAPSLTVLENLELASYAKRRDKADFQQQIGRVYDLFPVLAERRGQYAGLLSGGEQQMLAVGRALMTRPDVLVLDEPSMGLAPSIVDVLFTTISTLHETGSTILLVEQNAELALAVSDYVYVMHRGRIVAEGEPDELRSRPEIMTALFG
ncbi:ABC transporter ATP-binding protein [Acrocarpospora pleiomorpha]|uniref:ABC transporter ATP-binding protein n=1 Tax=Acrocarpospora pleiomorpha TaxID=90975 RepID=A0A5M3XMA9_9ACTN|nr:ABC transporter ATP-binding protein [Acrocarpospora pleiomorpha]GES22032.1 ABC transporter ATP-binding protein [Acrocarpospora pleiomorpha]